MEMLLCLSQKVAKNGQNLSMFVPKKWFFLTLLQPCQGWFFLLTLFCENYYFTEKIINLRRKLLFCEEKVGSKSKKVGSESTLLICEEIYYFTKKITKLQDYHFTKKITILRRKLPICEEKY